jgi:hypothetical protein
MSLSELLPSVEALPRLDKFRLMQKLATDLAREEGVAAAEFPIWTPLEAYEGAAVLQEFLERDKTTRQ